MSELIMILSGEDVIKRHRSIRALELYDGYNRGVPILVSGSHSGYLGRKIPAGMQPECHQVRDFLVSEGVPSRDILVEDSSLDTFGNFYFSHPLISERKSIDLVTDKFHMGRSLWCAKQVFGDAKKFSPCLTTQTQHTMTQRAFEGMQVALLNHDMADNCVAPGDYRALTRFMENVHPFYCSSTPEPSLFGTMVKFFGSKRMMMLLPTQKQAYQGLETA